MAIAVDLQIVRGNGGNKSGEANVKVADEHYQHSNSANNPIIVGWMM